MSYLPAKVQGQGLHCFLKVVSPGKHSRRVDGIGSKIMANYVDDEDGVPLQTTGDGDCLFNAVSILLYGDAHMSIVLKYHTCVQLVSNTETYFNHPDRRRIQ